MLTDDAMGSAAIATRKSLALYDSAVTLRGLRTLAARELPELRTLSLYMMNLGPALADTLAAAPWRSQLVVLNVCGNRLGPDGTATLMELAWPSLAVFAAGFDGLGDRGARAVASAALPVLASLNLRFNDIGPGGARALAARYAPQLVELGLEDNPLGAAGIEALAAAPFERLARIDVRDCAAGEARLGCAPWAAALHERDGVLYEGATLAPRDAGGEGARWEVRLAVVRGGAGGPEEHRLVGSRFTIGRARECSLPLRGINVSRVHGVLESDGDDLRIVDTGSSNGLYCNRELVGLQPGQRVQAGDELLVGGFRLRLLAIERLA